MLRSSRVCVACLCLAPSALAQYGPNGYGQQPQPNSLQAGGLTAPSTYEEPDPDEAEQRRRLDQAERSDSGRGLKWFHLDTEVGVQHLGLQTFKANNLVDSAVVGTQQTGLLVGAGVGIRLVFLTIGPRFRLANFSDFQVWTLNGEVGLRIPIGNLEPHFNLGAGYAHLGAFQADLNAEGVDISGFDIRGGGGLDYFVTPVFSVGASVTFETLVLYRSGFGTTQPSAGSVYEADGSSFGSAVSGTLVLGLHF
jgi:hypothetical protein